MRKVTNFFSMLAPFSHIHYIKQAKYYNSKAFNAFSFVNFNQIHIFALNLSQFTTISI